MTPQAYDTLSADARDGLCADTRMKSAAGDVPLEMRSERATHGLWLMANGMLRKLGPMLVVLAALGVAAIPVACRQRDQPSAQPAPSASASSLQPAMLSASSSASAVASASSSATVDAGPVIGDESIYAISIQTYVRAVAARGARALGYVRVGGSVRRSTEPVGTDGCKDGWYAVEPEGAICNGPDATLKADARILAYAAPGPARGQPMPYQYARVKGKVPHYYARMPSKQDRRRIEGGDVEGVIAGAFASPDPNLGLLGEPREIPPGLLDEERIPRPPGTAPRLRFKFHTGRAEPNTRLALMSWFEHDKRRWAITSQLDMIALDRVRIMKPPTFHGFEIGEEEGLPVAFVRVQAASGYRFDEEGKLTETVRLTHRQGLLLTGQQKKHNKSNLLETRDGLWVPDSMLQVIEKRETPTFVKKDTLRWIDISVKEQTMVAYRGEKPVYATLVSTGSGAMGDPETTHATPRGLFAIFSKHVSTKMSGDEIGAEYLIDDVPYVQYFHKGYALHGAFWHDNFGRVQSHGCVNLAPADAAWLFEFTGPEVPKGWHGVYVKAGGTPVLIRP